MKILALVTAKSQSTRVKDKNFHQLRGKRLYEWTLEFLDRNRNHFVDVIFSSDDVDKFDVPDWITKLTRPKVLCEDATPHILSVKHAMMHSEKTNGGLEADYVFLFQPTNPFRTSDDLKNVISMCEKYSPYIARTYYIDDNIHHSYVYGAKWDNDINEDGVIILSGAFYAYNRKVMLGDMREKYSDLHIQVSKHCGYNINNDDDFAIMEALMEEHKCELMT